MFYHPWINYLVMHGVPLQTVALLLMIPIVATLVGYFPSGRGYQGVRDLHPPLLSLLLSLAFDPNGLKYGIVIFVSIILVGMLSRYLLKHLRLLYLPRVALTITIVTLAILGILLIGGVTRRTRTRLGLYFPRSLS
ncbi:MAG: 7TM domain-containing protein [Candidatus Moraniibacteriota bacterium]